MEAYVGTIMLWPINWVPENWLACSGQTMQVQQYQALFSLIGNQYGGDGSSTFKLPNLSGRVAVGIDNQNFVFAKTGGQLNSAVQFSGYGVGSFTLNTAQMPMHSHSIASQPVQMSIPVNTTQDADQSSPGSSSVLGVSNFSDGVSTTVVNSYSSAAPNASFSPIGATIPASTTGPAGAGSPVQVPVDLSRAGGASSTIQPWAAMTYIICVYGLYPPRP